MESITDSADCRKCNECCKFRAGEEYFAPVFTEEELAKIEKDSEKANFNQFGTVKQAKLVKINDDLFACPFYSVDNGLCAIYKNRPFDCRIYPFLVARKNNKVYLTAFREACPSLEKKGNAKIKDYIRTLCAWLQKDENLKMFSKFPDLIWPVDDDQTIVCELAELNKKINRIESLI